MPLQIVELFGYSPHDQSPEAASARRERSCPFTSGPCTKVARDVATGVCTVRQRVDPTPIICCPTRLYADNLQAIEHVAEICFGSPTKLINRVDEFATGFSNVLAFGKGRAGELRIPKGHGAKGGYFVDWILAHLNERGDIVGLAAVEVQTIDTTGSYWQLANDLIAGRIPVDEYPRTWVEGGLNWENVNKRILPQLIFKGHTLRREEAGTKGLFFVCPKSVYERLVERLGEELMTYSLQPGALSFCIYDLGEEVPTGQIRSLRFMGMSTTTVDQAALAFVSPRNLPPPNSFLRAVRERLSR